MEEKSQTFRGFVTKYALTQGIEELDLRVCSVSSMVQVMGTNYSWYLHGEGKEWHRTRESAVKKAEEMRKKKIVSLRKQIEKLENLKF